MLEMLRPYFQGVWQPYGESLTLAQGSQARPSIAQWLLQPGALQKVLAQHAEWLRAPHLMRAIASDWSIRYVGTLLPPIVAAASLAKRRLPLGWHEMAFHLDAHGTPVSFEIGHLGSACEHAGAAERYETLMWQHLDPLLKKLGREARVPTKILWGNVYRALSNIFTGALDLLSHEQSFAQALTLDREQLLMSPTWPGGRRNPLGLRPRPIGNASTLVLHATCCLAYQLPQTGYCEACPLIPRDRRRRSPPNEIAG